MNRFTFTALAAAVVLASGSAIAQSKQPAPAAPPAQQTQEPSARSLDDNVQRQHGRDQATGPARSGTAPQTTGQTQARAGASAGEVRDWGAIDTNRDNLIQPEEMEAALKEAGTQAGKK